jgi:DNA-binding LacI/PurR family transcriptional regulator
MPNVRDIAKQAGVSIATVSRVLNNHPSVAAEVRERVLAAAGKSRYVSTIGRRSTSNVAFVYTGQPSLGSPFDAALMQGVSAGLEATNYDLLVIDARRALRRNERYAQLFMRKGVRGAIVRTDTHTRHECARIVVDNFPAVVVAEEFSDEAIPCVSADARTAVRRAIEHLIHLGHRRIAITLNIVDDHDHQQRLDAYKAAMVDAGLPVHDDFVLRVPAYRDAGAVALRQLMGSPNRPTAVFVTDPMAAVGVFHEAQRMGVRIPRDLSVVGFDDADQRFGVYPRMSAVCQDVERLGRDAFALLTALMERADDGASPATPGHECWFELHESTAPPPSGA